MGEQDIRMTNTAKRPRRGFTLLETLVVIAIIGILVAILLPTGYIAMTRAKNAKIAFDIDGLAQALKRYELKYGEYPPDFSMDNDSTADDDQRKLETLNRHLALIFRHRDAATDAPANLQLLKPNTALFFWLRGFSPDPRHPITGAGDRQPLFEFDQSRLMFTSQDYARLYTPPFGQNVPYLYYHHGSYGPAMRWAIANGAAMPYTSDIAGEFAERDRFQIISAGQDGEYGRGSGHFPSGNGYAEADRDNVTNFSKGTLEGARP